MSEGGSRGEGGGFRDSGPRGGGGGGAPSRAPREAPEPDEFDPTGPAGGGSDDDIPF